MRHLEIHNVARRWTLALACLAVPLSATPLQDKVATMQPGTWAELKTTGYTTQLISTGAVDNVLNYADAAVWDPIKREVRFTGGGHQEAAKMIIYSEATNAWTNATPPQQTSGSQSIHGYHHNAIDPATGINYYRPFYSTQVYKFSAGSWTKATALPGSDNDYACCGALNFFPEMGGLVFLAGGAIMTFKNSQWNTLKSGLAMGEYHNVAEYNPVYKTIYGGGGNDNRNLYSIDATGKVTTVSNVPVGLGIYSSVLTVDPVSGELLILGRNKAIWAYHPGSNAWKSLPAPTVGLFATGDNPIEFTVAAPIGTHGVVMFIRENAIFLYKHKPTGASSIQPAPGHGRIPWADRNGSRLSLHLGGDLLPGRAFPAAARNLAGRRNGFPDAAPVVSRSRPAAGIYIPAP